MRACVHAQHLMSEEWYVLAVVYEDFCGGTVHLAHKRCHGASL